MKHRYVLVSKNEDGVRVFGVYHDRDYAERIAAKINERIEAVEDRELAEWTSVPYEVREGMAPDGHGRVGVLHIHPHSAERAYRFALGENDS